MITLIRTTPKIKEYWQIWQKGEFLIQFQGKVGEQGEYGRLRVGQEQDCAKLMERYANQMRTKGFVDIEDEDRVEVIVQYNVQEFGTENDLSA